MIEFAMFDLVLNAEVVVLKKFALASGNDLGFTCLKVSMAPVDVIVNLICLPLQNHP